MSETNLAIQNKRQPLWPWVLGALVLCLFAVGLTFWWPMYRANELISKIREKGGAVDHAALSSKWQAVFGNRIHPWFHEVETISLRGDSLSDRELTALTHFSEVQYLFLNVTSNSNDALQQLGDLRGVTYLQLIGDGRSIQLDWIRTLPHLDHLSLWKLALTRRDWELLMVSRADNLQCYKCSIDAVPIPSTSLWFLDLHVVTLDEEHALAIQAISRKDFRLRLGKCPATMDFWRLLSTDSTLHSLELTEMEIDEEVIKSIARLPSLTSLKIEGYELPNNDCWQAIAQLPELKVVEISMIAVEINSPIGDAVAAEMAKSSSLERLILDNTNLTDEGLMELAELKSLKTVSLPNDTITPDGYQRFRAARPDVVFDR